ncbi:MAG: fructosamine kinase family protein [Clostridiales bacterium]|nr:fructosamine kinase family protein [Clostridiales bacterium]
MKYHTLEEAVKGACGEGIHIAEGKAVYGGDINRAYRLTLSDGSYIFMKCNNIKNFSFFKAEEEGLRALRAAKAIGVPKVLALGTDKKRGISFLLMEYINSGLRVKDYSETFGRELAMLHRAKTAEFVSENGELSFGFYADNYIGASPQKNTPKSSWAEFFRDCRLLPQMERAEKKLGAEFKRKCEKLLDKSERLLPEPEFPSLLHGDLWSGNSICGSDGKAWIFDPAVYVGNFEAELAMTELFGRLPNSFYGAYNEINHIDPGYEERKDLYNLYHLLNHLNLFGSSYFEPVRQVINRYV